jgi:hypothetical protein
LGLEHIEEFENVLRIESFEGVDFILQQHRVDRLFDHFHVDYLNIYMAMMYLDSDRILCVFIAAFVNFAAEPSPDLLVEGVTVMINGLAGLTFSIVGCN